MRRLIMAAFYFFAAMVMAAVFYLVFGPPQDDEAPKPQKRLEGQKQQRKQQEVPSETPVVPMATQKAAEGEKEPATAAREPEKEPAREEEEPPRREEQEDERHGKEHVGAHVEEQEEVFEGPVGRPAEEFHEEVRRDDSAGKSAEIQEAGELQGKEGGPRDHERGVGREGVEAERGWRVRRKRREWKSIFLECFF